MAENIEVDVAAMMKKMNGGGMKEDTNKYKNYDGGEKDRGNGGRQNQSGGNGGGQNRFDGNGGRNQYSGNGGNRGGGRPGGVPSDLYVGAPYNFVSFSDQVYSYSNAKRKLTNHNDMKAELSTGEITYEITAKTPIFIDDGNGEFYQNARGEFAIPGSTMRGLIRNNVQILGLSSMADDIDDYALMYRNVAAGLEQARYKEVLGAATITLETGAKNKQVSILKNVRAGYIRNVNGKYFIYKTEVDQIRPEYENMNYYPLSERKVIDAYLDLKDGEKFSYEFFYHNKNNILQNEFERFKDGTNWKTGKAEYIGRKNEKYKPYSLPVSYEIKNLKEVTAVGVPGRYRKKGYVVSSGWMSQKKILYIIPQIDESKEPIPVSEKDLEAFRIDYKKRENKLADKDKENRAGFFNLPFNGETKPVFYIELDGRLYFGFTPRLRLFYDHTIKEGLNQAHKEGILDYAKAMFGYADENGDSAAKDNQPKSYRTKLSFSDAVLVSEKKDILGKSVDVILGEPKPTCCPEYIKPRKDGALNTYNSDSFQLRGVKQYWLHGQVVPTAVEAKQKNVASVLHPIREGVKFRGKVRFQNLTPDELGLLLWSIRLNQGCCMNVGKAKSYGYGQVQLDILKAEEIDLDRAYATDTLDLEPFRQVDVEKAIRAYKDVVNGFLSSRRMEIDNMPHIKEFFAMKDVNGIPEDADTRYMMIQKEITVPGKNVPRKLNEYQEQMKKGKPLPEVLKVAKKR